MVNKFERERAQKYIDDFNEKSRATWNYLHAMNAQLREAFIQNIIREHGTRLHKWLVKYPRIYGLWIFHYMKPRVFTKKDDMNYFVVIFRSAKYDIEVYREALLEKAKLEKEKIERESKENS